MNIKAKTIENDLDYLKQVSKKVDLNDNELESEIKLLNEYAKETECFALASVQIGIPKRIIYLKNTTLDMEKYGTDYNENKILINPVIISRKGKTQFWEACLSCLDLTGLVNRPYELEVEYINELGSKETKTFVGFEATVIAHEMDHLDGILHTDIAEKVLKMNKEERMNYRLAHPYKIISKDCEYK